MALNVLNSLNLILDDHYQNVKLFIVEMDKLTGSGGWRASEMAMESLSL